MTDSLHGAMILAVRRKGKALIICAEGRELTLTADGDYKIQVASPVFTTDPVIDKQLTDALAGHICQGIDRKGLLLKLFTKGGVEATLQADITGYIHCRNVELVHRLTGQDVTLKSGM